MGMGHDFVIRSQTNRNAWEAMSNHAQTVGRSARNPLVLAWLAAVLGCSSEPSSNDMGVGAPGPPAGAAGGSATSETSGDTPPATPTSTPMLDPGPEITGDEAPAAPTPSNDGGESTEPADPQGDSQDSACTRELLGSTVESYFAALAAGDPSTLPLADGVRFTENGVVLELGEGLWQNAGAAAYKHSALDAELCTSATEAVVPEDGVDLPIALRLKLVGGEIAEIETIVARPGDYVIFGSPFESDPDAIIASASLGWEEPVAEAERADRERIDAWITRYFESFPNGGCDLAEDCLRLENGGGSFSCSLGASCTDGAGDGAFGGPLDARLVVVDEVTGVGAGFTMFMGNTDMHMIMLRREEVRAVHTILSGADGPGWE